MENILIAARVVIPMILMIGLGVLIRVTGVIDPASMKKADRLIFKVFLPFMAFCNIYRADFSRISALGLILYCVAGMTAVFMGCLILIPRFIHHPPLAAAFGQAMLRPNYLVFGVAVAQSLYGAENMAILLLVGMVIIPVYNVCVTVVLERWREEKTTTGHMLLAILKNPMILACFLGAVVNLCGIRLPELLVGVLEDVGGITTPFCFISMGVGLSFAWGPKMKLAVITAGIRLILVPVILVTGGVLLGFRGIGLCTVMILFASPTAVASYPTAVAMGADHEYTGQAVAVSLLSCMATIFAWIYVLSILQLL